MSVHPRGMPNECCRPPARCFTDATSYTSVYWPPPRRGQPRQTPFQRATARYYSEPSNAPVPKPCCYDLPCKADCFSHNACTRPSGRYARTVWYPGECPAKVPACQAFTCPNPPYPPCCYYTCNRHV